MLWPDQNLHTKKMIESYDSIRSELRGLLSNHQEIIQEDSWSEEDS